MMKKLLTILMVIGAGLSIRLICETDQGFSKCIGPAIVGVSAYIFGYFVGFDKASRTNRHTTNARFKAMAGREGEQ